MCVIKKTIPELLEILARRFGTDEPEIHIPKPVVFAQEEVICQYCGNAAERVYGDVIYPHIPDLHSKQYYLCMPCDAYVGCNNAGKPLGYLANDQLRTLRRLAHKAFDPIWQDYAIMTRTNAYRWLAKQLGLRVEDCHIGKFDVDTCRKVVRVCKKYLYGGRNE